MTEKIKKFSSEQRISLLKDCIESKLTIREYAMLKNVGYSTLTGWATQEGISLKKEKKKFISETLAKANLGDEAPNTNADLKDNGNEGFSFINITDHIKNAAPPLLSSATPQASQALHCPKDSHPCGLEIRMPNGVMLKVEQVPFGALWPQVVEFVRALA